MDRGLHRGLAESSLVDGSDDARRQGQLYSVGDLRTESDADQSIRGFGRRCAAVDVQAAGHWAADRDAYVGRTDRDWRVSAGNGWVGGYWGGPRGVEPKDGRVRRGK